MMWQRIFTFFVLVSGTALLGCTPDGPFNCSNDQCPAGYVCVSGGSCAQLCTVDSDCIAGRYCAGDICKDGLREAPIVSSIAGNSSQTCAPSFEGTTQTGACLGDGIVVSGDNLAGSSFQLFGQGVAANVYTLKPLPGGRNTSTVVDLAPVDASGNAVDIVQDFYVLVAVNQAGQSQTGVRLLQGEPGPDADGNEIIGRINAPGVSNTINSNRINLNGNDIIAAINSPSTMSSITRGLDGEAIAASINQSAAQISNGTTFFYYDNSSTATATLSGGDRMHVILNATAPTPASVAVNKDRLVQLCGDRDGCAITLGATGFRRGNGSACSCNSNGACQENCGCDVDCVYNTPSTGGTCRFYLAPSGDWSVAADCMRWYATWGADASGNPLWNGGSPGFFAPYFGTPNGVDGNSTTSVVMHYAGACYFAENGPASSPNTFVDDSGHEGFVLFNSTSTWQPTLFPGGFWPESDPARTCELTIED